MIRRAEEKDIEGLIELLYQVDAVHHGIRPDLFKGNTPKYSEQDLKAILTDEDKPIFVYDEGKVLGHAFCQVSEVRGHRLLQDVKTLYIDDICVDETARGKHIGQALYEFVRDSAFSFYKSMGMQVQKTGMESIL